jgi:hypothetical protein
VGWGGIATLEMGEDLLDDGGVLDASDDPHCAAAVFADTSSIRNTRLRRCAQVIA